MTTKTMDLFPETKPPRKRPRTIAHMSDVGPDMVEFECRKCGWSSDWLPNDFTWTEIFRGIPCEVCNSTN